jgi:glycosyltransferase involved in cell wall biosynthesis
MAPLRILHVTPYYAPAWTFGGVVSAVTGLATAQAERGHQVTVLTSDALDRSTRNPLRQEVIDNVTVIRCRNISTALHARLNLSIPPGMWASFRHLAPNMDVVHIHELRTVENLLIDHQGAIVLSPHGTLSLDTGRSGFKQAWDMLFGRALLQKIDAVAALTQTEIDEARKLFEQRGVAFPVAEIVPNGVAPDFVVSGNLRKKYNLGDGPVVLFMGRLHERKGLQYLIPAFAEATKNNSSARLMIVGPDDGMLSTSQTLAAQFGVAQQVIFTGLLKGEERRAALATSDVFILPAVGEGLSMAVLEAMVAGLPVIITPGCNLPDVKPRGAGLLVEREVGPLAGALHTLLGDRAKRQQMGEAGQAWVKEQFTWPAIAEQTERLYDRVRWPRNEPQDYRFQSTAS